MIRALTSLTKDLKRQGINPGFYFMDNESSTALNLTMTTINTNYQLFPLSNHRAKNTEREIQTFKNRFIAGLCSVDKYFHLQLWDRLLQQATISLYLTTWRSEERRVVILYQVRLKVCGWNQIIRRCKYRLRCGEGFLIAWACLDWLLPSVRFCTINDD